MATTAKTKNTKSTKTIPARKPAKKPAGASVKPKQTKTVAKSSKTKTVSTKSNCRGCEIFFGIMMTVLALVILIDIIIHVCFWIFK